MQTKKIMVWNSDCEVKGQATKKDQRNKVN